MKVIKRIMYGILTFALAVGAFAGSGMEVRAEESIDVVIQSLYIDTSGNNHIVVDKVSTTVGTAWIDFLAGYDLDANNPSDEMEGTGWKTEIQTYGNTGVDDPNRLTENDTINNNAYHIWRMGIPGGYERSAFTFAVHQNGTVLDQGVGGDIIRCTAYERFSEQDYSYIRDNVTIYGFMEEYLSVEGTTVEISPYPNGQAYIFDITWPDSAEEVPVVSDSSTNDSDNPSDEPTVEEEPQTPENNYIVFHESVKADIDVAIAQAQKAAQEAVANGTRTPANPIVIDTGVWISFKGDVYQKMQDSGLPVQITFIYKGVRYRVNIPAGADLMSLVDENGYCGFLNLMAHFGGTVL